jgi:AcrR family transcriptional regulator
MPQDSNRALSAPVETERRPDLSTPELSTLDRLLDTAAGLFWEKGYAATTTREIAAALGIQQASLYYHMASKEGLLYQICVSSLNQMLTNVPPALKEIASPLDRVRILIQTHVTALLRYQKRNVTMLTELRALSPRHRAEIVALRERYADFVRSTLEQAQVSGVIRADIPPKHLSLALFNLLNWTALWFHPDETLSPGQLSELFTDIYLNGVAGPRACRSLTLPDFETQARKPSSRARKTLKLTENRTVERLVDAATALFSRKGYAATSTREVAALLGIQKASLYYHIEGKEDLLYLICKSSLEQIRKDVEAALDKIADPLERIRTLILAHIESMLRDEDKHATTLAEMHALGRERLAEVLSLRDAYEGLVRSVLQDAQIAGALRGDIDVKYVCLSLLGLMNRVLVWYRRKGPLSPGQIGQLFAVIFLTGVRAGSATDIP